MLRSLGRNYVLQIVVTLNVQFKQRELAWFSLKKVTTDLLCLTSKRVRREFLILVLLTSGIPGGSKDLCLSSLPVKLPSCKPTLHRTWTWSLIQSSWQSWSLCNCINHILSLFYWCNFFVKTVSTWWQIMVELLFWLQCFILLPESQEEDFFISPFWPSEIPFFFLAWFSKKNIAPKVSPY